jgi:hypothetical protein
MADERDAAAILYPTTPQEQASPPASEVEAGDQAPTELAKRRGEIESQREQLEVDTQALEEAERAEQKRARDQADGEDTPEEKLFGDPKVLASTYAPALSDSLDAWAELSPELAAQRAQIVEGTAMLFHEARIAPEQAAGLHSLFVNTLKAPPDAATIEQWNSESKAWLQAQYGEDAQKVTDRLRQFVHARPDLLKIFELSGLGAHPRVVAALAENQNALRMTPRKRSKP